MKRRDIYIGKVKKCKCLSGYLEYGDSRYVLDFRINKTEFGYIENNAYVVDEYAVLIKVSDKRYIWLKTIEDIFEEMLINFGIELHSLRVEPLMDGELFVDEYSLVSYYENDLEKNINVRRLRLDTLGDARIPGGIEY